MPVPIRVSWLWHERITMMWKTEWEMPSKWLFLAKQKGLLRHRRVRKLSMPSGGSWILSSVVTFSSQPYSGKCVYQAESSHSILSDVCVRCTLSSFVQTFIFTRLTSALLCIFMTHIRRLYWIIIGWSSNDIMFLEFQTYPYRLKVPAIRSVLEYSK